MTKQNVLIVGGTAGIGRAVAQQLAQGGYHVIIIGRNQQAGEDFVKAHAPGADFLRGDVSLMAEVVRLVKTIKARYASLHLVIHTADVLRVARQDTPEGLEVSMATNYFSRFLFNHLLLGTSPAYAPARIVHVAAAGYPPGKHLSKFPLPAGASSFTGHGIGQILNDVYGITLAEQLKGKATKINILNPGIVDTDIRRNGDFPKWLRLLEPLFNLLLKPIRKTPGQYARVVVEVALGKNPVADQSVLITAKGKAMKGSPTLYDQAVQQRIWQQTLITLSGILPVEA